MSDDQDPLTNVVQLRDLVEPRYSNPETGAIEEQRTYYDQGIGTGMVDRFRGGVFGHGLAENVQQAYRYLSHFYKPGVEIYIFGFSRGAFTARSLAGYVGAAGLLRSDLCTPELMARCWAYYRTPPEDRYPAEKAVLSRFTHEGLRITCLGVFDTVGALGVPLGRFKGLTHRYQFHDTALSSIVDHAFHAIAVDEKRGPFKAAVWAKSHRTDNRPIEQALLPRLRSTIGRHFAFHAVAVTGDEDAVQAKPQHKNDVSIEQVWFPGVHSNIGGGYAEAGLSNLTLRWMIDRMKCQGLGLVLGDAASRIEGDPFGNLYESRTAPYAYSKIKPRIRVINQTGHHELRGSRLSSLSYTTKPTGEMLHWSVLKRWTESHLPGSMAPYEPPNVAVVLRSIYDSGLASRLPVVGPSSEPLAWQNVEADFEFLLSIMPEEHRAGLLAARNYGG